MKAKETAEELTQKIARLPAWAQKHIETLTRERNRALEAQQEYLDEQTESPFYVEFSGPQNRQSRFVQAHSMTVRWQGVKLRVDANPYGNAGDGIRLSWESDDHREAALIPSHFQGARIVNISHMR
jgi:C4-dicarboxylate-specific signal transduction histidine kinase